MTANSEKTHSVSKESTSKLRDGAKEVLKSRQMRIQRYFSQAGIHPFEQLEWEIRTAKISGEKGEIVFEQNDVEVPAGMSQLATQVIASKYFYGEIGTSEREHSFKELVHRSAVLSLTGVLRMVCSAMGSSVNCFMRN